MSNSQSLNSKQKKCIFNNLAIIIYILTLIGFIIFFNIANFSWLNNGSVYGCFMNNAHWKFPSTYALEIVIPFMLIFIALYSSILVRQFYLHKKIMFLNIFTALVFITFCIWVISSIKIAQSVKVNQMRVTLFYQIIMEKGVAIRKYTFSPVGWIFTMLSLIILITIITYIVLKIIHLWPKNKAKFNFAYFKNILLK
jgi:hypothetical protein